MRRLYLSVLILLGMSAVAQAQAPTPELLWYKFDGSGTSVPNLATSPPTGTGTATLMGGLTQGPGALCNGVVFGSGAASSTDYVNTGWAPNVGTGSWTIAWRAQGISTNGTLYYIFGDAGTASFRCFTNGVAGSTNWIIRGGGLTDVYINGGALSTPTVCAYVYDQSLAQVRAYLNGVLVSTVAQGAVNLTGTGPFKVIGYSSNVGAPAGGQLDDFRFYNRALTQPEIQAIVNGDFHTGFLGGDQALCPGDTIALTTSPYITTTTTWSTGSTTDSIWVDSAGTYSVSWTGACEQGADTITVTNAPAPPAAGFAGPDDTICVGDTIMLGYSTNDPILWSTGDTTDTIWVSSTGTYTVEVNAQCGTAMDTIVVAPSALVYTGFAVADTTTACEGDTVNLSTSMPFSTYAWSTGDTTQMSWASTSGTYTVNVTDACGSGSDSVAITFIQGVLADFSFTTNQLTATFTNSTTGGGTITYDWNFGDSNTSNSANPSHTYAASGTYVVVLTATSECGISTFTDTVTVTGVAIDDVNALELRAYPNPATDRVAVKAQLGTAQDLHLSIVSLQGQVVIARNYAQVSGSFRQEIDLSELAAGTYLLQLQGEQGGKVIRLVVQ